jgi:anti-sigma regulatory factor (Ser/Thr protein kinase)
MNPGFVGPHTVSAAGVGERSAAHDHVVGFYERDDELITTVSQFLATALNDHGAAVVIATGAHRAALETALVASGVPVDDLIRSGRYLPLDAAETLAAFMQGHHPDPAAFASVIGGVLDDLGGDGPVHAFGEMVALLWDAGDVAAAIELESLWNDLAEDHTFSLYCAYAMSSLEQSGDLAAAKRVCDRHSDVASLPSGIREVESETFSGSDEFARLFVPVPAVVREVRGFVRDVFRAWGEEACTPEAEIIVAELATNAVVHARSPFRVAISRTKSEIKLSVRDASTVPPEQPAGNLGVREGRAGGRGISMVASLSLTWDTHPEPDGKTIWATMTRSV